MGQQDNAESLTATAFLYAKNTQRGESDNGQQSLRKQTELPD